MELNQKNTTSFFNNEDIPVEMEMSFLGLCLGGFVNFKKDKKGLNMVCFQVPRGSDRQMQPIVFTVGENSQCLAPDARSGLYHALGLDSLIREVQSNNASCQNVMDVFSKTFSRMGGNNKYLQTFFEEKEPKLRDRLLGKYPERIKDWDSMVSTYKTTFTSTMNGATKDESKKKPQMM